MTEEEVIAIIASERRRRQGMKYNAPNQLYLDHTTQNSVVDSGELGWGGSTASGPRIFCGAGMAVTGGSNNANEVACAWEYFNQDPWADPTRGRTDTTGRSDALFSSSILVAGFPMLVFAFDDSSELGFIENSFCGIGIGSSFGTTSHAAPAAELTNAVHISMRYNFTTTEWSIKVVNKWAAVGHRVFTKVLGTTAALGIVSTAMTIGVGTHWELEWLPSSTTPAVRASVDGVVIGTFTDADAGGDTPLADIYSHKNSTGETIKGCGFFAALGSDCTTTNASLSVAFVDFYREITAHF